MARTPDSNSKMARLHAFRENPPADWDSLKSNDRKARAAEATDMTPAYLNSVIARDEALKDFFAIARRAPRKARRKAAAAAKAASARQQVRPARSPRGRSPEVAEMEKQMAGMELGALIEVSKTLRRTIEAKLREAKAELEAYRVKI